MYFFVTDWNGVTIAFMVLGLLFHFIAFIVAIVAACRKGHPFPSFWVAGIFFVAGKLVLSHSSSAKVSIWNV